ncbi:hypothetical protein [Amycolatopsis taiwanensis]|uniref:restriction system modified-DNA reader domain-containing protein n=1 Tax=Amycolatopsis taiwanensis TaxID=342230 RepID=UPI0004B858A3|nr:hypothetical protein [Amycolatopsis taiwanensis]
MWEWEELPPNTMILAPAFDPPPMRCPDGVWAMLVAAVDLVGDADPDRAGGVALFAGCWVPDQPPADGLYGGDLVVRLTNPAGPTYPLPYNHVADVEMLLAFHGRWQCVGRWCGVDDRWPHIVAPAAAAVMGLHGVLREATVSCNRPQPPITWTSAGVAELLDAGLVKVGEELLFWNQRNLGIRHSARIRADGALVLTDGQVYANPSGATTALGGTHQNIWGTFRRASDGRT